MENYADINPKLTYNKKICQQHFNNENINRVEGYSEFMSRAIQIEETQLSEEYFSQKNMKKIQEQLKKTIYIKTHGKFKLDVDQDKNDLLIVMRSIFIDHGKFMQQNIKNQVDVLNKKTVEYIVPEMITQIKQQYGYLKEISKPLQQIDRPLNVNRAGRKTLPSYTSVFGF